MFCKHYFVNPQLCYTSEDTYSQEILSSIRAGTEIHAFPKIIATIRI